MLLIGVDIGGTKCAVNLGEISGDEVKIIYKCNIKETKKYLPQEMMDALVKDILFCKGLTSGDEIQGIGISCGGPLDGKKGIIMSPPNLPGWDNIHITKYFKEKTGLKSWLCNDANACALAEWKLGAGRGTSNMIFMTFGTGLGAGLILDNRLYSGTNDMAGELGHIRICNFGPVGYGKMGSFEGFCSGGGIAQLAKSIVLEELQKGNKPDLCPDISEIQDLTAEKVGVLAKKGDELAKKILKIVGINLGKGLAILIDLLNPERIVIGSIFVRCYEEIWPWANKVIEEESLLISRKVCQVVPSELSESVGDVAALVIAEYYSKLEGENESKN
jgi:glucokinase